jgi:hypothetical protein
MPGYGNKRAIRSCKTEKKHKTDKQLLANTTQKTKSKLEQRELY